MIWKAIPGYPGYEASDEGGVRRVVIGLNGRRPTVLACHLLRSTGYWTALVKNEAGERKSVCVHRLVCLAFHGLPPSPQHQVAHADGSRTNNRPPNLRWATPRENAADRSGHGRDRLGSQQRAAKLLEENIPLVFDLAARGFGQREIGALFRVHQSTIWKILNGEAWTHVSVPLGLIEGTRA